MEHYINSIRASNEQLKETEIINIISKISMALSMLHSKKIIHRDLKPTNIFLFSDGSVKLGDFGLSHSLKASHTSTKSGTLLYLPPEMINNSIFSEKGDVWALGCIGYELCMLKHPFEYTSIGKVTAAISTAIYEPITTSYSRKLINLISNMLEANEKQRPSSEEIVQICTQLP